MYIDELKSPSKPLSECVREFEEIGISAELIKGILPYWGQQQNGLHDVVHTEEIQQLASQPHLETAVNNLIQTANERYGGPDNITVILIEP